MGQNSMRPEAHKTMQWIVGLFALVVLAIGLNSGFSTYMDSMRERAPADIAACQETISTTQMRCQEELALQENRCQEKLDHIAKTVYDSGGRAH